MADAMDADSDVKRFLLAAVVFLSAGLTVAGSSAAAFDCSGGGSSSGATTASTAANGILLNGEQHVSGDSGCAGSPGSSVSTVSAPEPPRDSDLDAVCVRQAITIGRNPFAMCDLPSEPASPAAPPQVTSALVLAAFRRIELPASELVVQPPGGETLVNFDTNFYTEQGAFSRTVNLLGKRVELRIWPSQYEWVFGDGSSLASESAGAPYPDLLITHDYRSRGGVSPRVDTTYAARFRVDGGPWRDVDGTVTVAGAPVQLQVRTATPVLVGYH